MGKPLLTDEIIEKANRGELDVDKSALADKEETKIIATNDKSVIGDEDMPEMVYKSRRIENAKRNAFQDKLNKILIVVILLVILLFWAAFNL